jgi:hypothetical protein
MVDIIARISKLNYSETVKEVTLVYKYEGGIIQLESL